MNINNILNGALVADAASLGLHWLYDQSRIASIAATENVLFREPNEADYKDCQGYFAHGLRHSGDVSHYGEAALVVQRALADQDLYAVSNHRLEFMKAFGPCGTFIGYADRPTKALVKTLLDDSIASDLITGSDDDQLPALACIPALVVWSEHKRVTDPAALDKLITDAVSVTTINEEALLGARTLTHCLKAIVNGASLEDALAGSTSTAGGSLGTLLDQALALPEYDPLGAANLFGLPCHIQQGLPLSWHILKHAGSYEAAITDNVLCGGDCCGRAMAIGSIAGLVYGVPEALQGRAKFSLG